MSTQTNIAWYYVGVAVLLLFGQNYVLNGAHKDAVTKLTAKYEAQLAAAGVTPAPVSTLAQAPAAAPPVAAAAAPAATPVPVAAAKPAPAAAEPAKPIIASPAPAKASAGSGRALPLSLAFRSEPFNKNSRIVTLTNTSKEKLDCNVRIRRPSTGESQTFKVSVAGAGEIRLAGAEAWTFKTGDRIELALAGFKTKTTSVP